MRTPDSYNDWPEEWQDLIAGAALDQLDPDDKLRLEQLLSEYPALREELTLQQTLLDYLPETLDPQTPDSALEETLIRAVGSTPHLNWEAPVAQPRRAASGQNLWRWGTAIGGAIALLALLLLGRQNLRLQSQLVQHQQKLETAKATIDQLEDTLRQTQTVFATLRRPGAVVHSLEGVGELNDAAARLITAPEYAEVALVSSTLPPLDPNQTYRLWASIDGSDELTYCGQFNMNDTGAVQWRVPDTDCVNRATEVIITRDAVSSEPTLDGSEPIMRSSQS
ncbi:MAG: anti-sigma factor [Cyanobacteria bacterium P01_C01_bin.73]